MLRKEYNTAIQDLDNANNCSVSPENFKNKAKCNEELDQIQDAMTNYENAIKLAKAEISRMPELKKEKSLLMAETFLERGRLLVRLKRNPTALQDFTDAIKIATSGDTKISELRVAEMYLERGKSHREVVKYEESVKDLLMAVSKLEKATSGISGDKSFLARAHNELGLSYYESKHMERALEQFNKAIDNENENSVFYNNRGLTHLHNGSAEMALVDFKKAIELNDQDPKGFLNRGDVYCVMRANSNDRKFFQLAHEDYDRAIELAYEMPEYENNCSLKHAKGLAYQEEGNLEEKEPEKYYQLALECFYEAKELDPEHSPPIFHYGQMQHKLGDLDGALESFTRVIELDSKKHSPTEGEHIVYEARGRVFQDKACFEDALADFDRAIELNPDGAECYYYRGLVKNSLKMYQEAIEDFENALEKKSQNEGGIYNGLGYSYKMKGDFSKALAKLTDAVEKEPENPEFLLQRSILHMTQRRFGEAIKDLTQSLSYEPTDPFMLYKRGVARYHSKQFEPALQDLLGSLQNQPDESYQPDIHYHVGLCYANLDEYENSIGPYSRALDMLPFEAVYYHERAKAYLLTEEYELALEDFNRVIEMQPTNSHAHFGRGFAYKNMREYEKASEDFERAKEISPDDPQLILNYKTLFNTKFIKLCEPGEEQV